MSDIVAVVIENPEQPIKAILAPGTGEVSSAIISEIGPDGLSGYSGYSGLGFSGYSGFCGTGTSGYSGFSGQPGAATASGYSGFSGTSGYSGYSGSGVSGYSGFCGTGTSGFSGYSGFCGLSGYSGFSSTSGYSGFCGLSGYSGFCGLSGYSGFCGAGTSGFSGYSGDPAQQSGYSGFSGKSGYSGFCGLSGYSGFCGASGFSGYSGDPAQQSGYSGYSGKSGYSGFCGLSGYSGFSGLSGYSGFCGLSGYSGFSGTSGYSGFCGLSGYSGFCGLSGYSGFSGFSGFSGPAINKLLFTQNAQIGLIAGTAVTKAGTITGTAGVGSSLFLGRIMVPAAMSLTEIQCAMSIGFPATNQGAGTVSRSMVIYSFGNSTSLASVLSKSGTSAWATGTSTVGGNVSLTQFQGGWSAPFIQPMTFASSALPPGEYVVGQLFDFAQGSSTWTLALYGDQAYSTFLASAATNLTSATIGAVSVATIAGSGITGISSYASQFLALSTSGSMTGFSLTAASSATVSANNAVSVSITHTTKTASFALMGQSNNSNILSSVGTVAGSIVSGLTTLGAVTNVALGALNSSTLAQLTQPNFGFIGTNSTTSGFPTVFIEGIMSTGAVPVAITLTSTAVTFSGSAAFQQPWYALCGA